MVSVWWFPEAGVSLGDVVSEGAEEPLAGGSLGERLVEPLVAFGTLTEVRQDGTRCTGGNVFVGPAQVCRYLVLVAFGCFWDCFNLLVETGESATF